MDGDDIGGDAPATFQSSFGPPEPPSHAVVRSVATLEGVDPVNLDATLYGIVDPDALDGLLAHAARTGGAPVSVTVTVAGYEIRVCSDRSVTIRRARTSLQE